MNINIEKIYRVIYSDCYQSTTPETNWCYDKQKCIDYINSKYYKQFLSIEESIVADNIITK